VLVFWKARLVFLAVPKTGSTAYAEALGPLADMVVRAPPELKHAPLYRYNRFFRPMFEKQGATDLDVVAVMREPVDWLASWYRFRRRPFMRDHPNSTANMDFDSFVAAYASPTQPSVAEVGSQATFLAPRRNGTRVHHLYRYDDLAALNRFLQTRLSQKFDVPRCNVSPDGPTMLSEATLAQLQHAAEDDFALYASIPDGGLHAKDPI